MVLAQTEILLAIANVIFIIVAIFLFIRLRRTGKKGETEKKQSELSDIAEISPEQEGIEVRAEETKAPATTELRLEDVFPEAREAPRKKAARKKTKKLKAAKKEVAKKVAKKPKEGKKKVAKKTKEKKAKPKKSAKKKTSLIEEAIKT